MRITTTLSDLTEEEWTALKEFVQDEYEIPEGADRVCLTFSYGDEVRHVEMARGNLISVLRCITLLPIQRSLQKFREAWEAKKASSFR